MTTTKRTCVPEFVIKDIENFAAMYPDLAGHLVHHDLFLAPFPHSPHGLCYFDSMYRNVTGFRDFRARVFAATKFNHDTQLIRQILEM